MESDEDGPIPVKYVTVWRHTVTIVEQLHERDIFDVGVGNHLTKLNFQNHGQEQ